MDHPQHIVAVSGLISHLDGRILLIRGPRRGWEFPGGQVEEGQLPPVKARGLTRGHQTAITDWHS